MKLTARQIRDDIRAADIGWFRPISSGMSSIGQMQHGTQHGDWSRVIDMMREAHQWGCRGLYMLHRPAGEMPARTGGWMKLDSFKHHTLAQQRAITIGLRDVDTVARELGVQWCGYYGTPVSIPDSEVSESSRFITRCLPPANTMNGWIALDRTAAIRPSDEVTARKQNAAILGLYRELAAEGRKVIIEGLARTSNPDLLGMPSCCSLASALAVARRPEYQPGEAFVFTTGNGVKRGDITYRPRSGAALAWLCITARLRGIPMQLLLHTLNEYDSVRHLKSDAAACVPELLDGASLLDFVREVV